ncbi:MAG: hypothetical protein PF487_14475 [Bacteroidales bacterium]|jgi:hypothetical protein|nr:hypothetical protein [Bacteroidales bacterium]
MHDIEPFYMWRELYISSDDVNSPFFGKENSEFYFTDTVYDYYIHPQWDNFGSETLYLKIIYANNNLGYAIIEFIGEWNDLLYNDIMKLKRNIIEVLLNHGINKFILIGENVLNFHASDDLYYEEWFDDVEDGWIVGINFRDHVIQEFENENIDYFIAFGGRFDNYNWRTQSPKKLCLEINSLITNRLNP